MYSLKLNHNVLTKHTETAAVNCGAVLSIADLFNWQMLTASCVDGWFIPCSSAAVKNECHQLGVVRAE